MTNIGAIYDGGIQFLFKRQGHISGKENKEYK